ncbi:MAG: hypothetical protein KatS3mg114_1336 [Planctomycetaceae bacterium]|nr:MAG: hypothetical protein KatS3mg114_1336 [Planctomycetaceae bacterium]
MSQTAAPTSASAGGSERQQIEQLFATGRVTPEVIRQLVNEWSTSRQFERVITLIETAILHGHSEPWMYEALALTMELAGRPREQIERVLLSSRDVTPADVESLLFLAAYLARFERWAMAIECCRQAAEVMPQRPEPYLQALRYAERLRDDEQLAWSALGVLTYDWTRERSGHRAAAEGTLHDVRRRWQQQGAWARCLQLEAAWQQARTCDLHLRVEFLGQGDLDLSIVEPQGAVCSFEQPFTAGGGIFLHDGYGPRAEDCYEEYVCPVAWNGEYRVQIRVVSGQIVAQRARLIIVRGEGGPHEHREELNIPLERGEQVIRLNLRQGRRQEAGSFDHTRGRTERGPLRPASHVSWQQLPIAGARPPVTSLAQVAGAGTGTVVGYQPVVTFVPSGVSASAQAVISADRRFVRLTLQPMFREVVDVFTFSFFSGAVAPQPFVP